MKLVNLFFEIIGLSFGTALIGYAVGYLLYYDWKKMSRRTKIEFFSYLFLGLFIVILSL